MGRLPPKETLAFQETILAHFHEEGRVFPWRETRDPYSVLVSEIMLQQTQTDRVVPKYLQWLSVFPTIASLASAPFSAVLENWIGLGYNRRARYLHETAKIIHCEYSGIFPEDPDVLDSLPGIGPYTARAVSTFSFGRSNVFIETNIRAVFLFFFFPERESVSDSEILELVAETVFGEDPRAWYYALMDYGSALKKKIPNPNRKSRHYAKQSQFEGSLRQARGAVIRFLGAGKQAGLEAIAEEGSIPYDLLERAAQALLAEGLVCENAGVYRISV